MEQFKGKVCRLVTADSSHSYEKWDPGPFRIKVKSRIRIRIKVKIRIRMIRISAMQISKTGVETVPVTISLDIYINRRGKATTSCPCTIKHGT
jgi:hypothetical protein